MPEYLDAPDTAHSALKTDHKYNPGKNKNGLCIKCGLGRATHGESVKAVYKEDERRLRETPFRCATCIAERKDVCQHQQIQK